MMQLNLQISKTSASSLIVDTVSCSLAVQAHLLLTRLCHWHRLLRHLSLCLVDSRSSALFSFDAVDCLKLIFFIILQLFFVDFLELYVNLENILTLPTDRTIFNQS